MREPDSLAVARRFYAALDADDAAAVLALCDPGIEVRYPAHGRLAYGGDWDGPEGMGRFLEAHDEAEEVLAFEVDELLAAGEAVLALGSFRGRAKPAGVEWQTRFVHLLRVRQGRLTSFQAYFDTAAAVAAHAS